MNVSQSRVSLWATVGVALYVPLAGACVGLTLWACGKVAIDMLRALLVH
jgi:hypothetical protein